MLIYLVCESWFKLNAPPKNVRPQNDACNIDSSVTYWLFLRVLLLLVLVVVDSIKQP